MNSIKGPTAPSTGSSAVVRLLLCVPLFATAAPAPAVADEYAVFKSTDRARSWVRADTGLPLNARVNAIGQVDGIFLAATDAGVFRSTDSAATWRPTPLTEGSSVRVLDFATQGSRLFAASEGAQASSFPPTKEPRGVPLPACPTGRSDA